MGSTNGSATAELARERDEARITYAKRNLTYTAKQAGITRRNEAYGSRKDFCMQQAWLIERWYILFAHIRLSRL